MTIRYTCDGCGSVLNIKDEKAGTQGKCPKCKAEFLVPAPDEVEADGVDVGELEGADSEGAGPDSSHELVSTATEKGSDDFSDDEIEKILESNEAKKRPANDYGVAAGADDDDDLDDDDDAPGPTEEDEDAPLALSAKRRKPVDFDDDDDDDDDEEEEERPRGRRVKEKSPARGGARDSAGTSAGVAKGLMARGDKGAKTAKDERRSKRPFGGGGEHEGGDDEEGFSLKEKAGYLARFAVPAVIALVLAAGYYTWYIRGWQRGDLPELASVTGVVKLDGTPLAKAEIQYIPQQADPNKPNLKVSSSQAITNDSGEFTLGYNLYAQGAVIGRHRVQIICYSADGKQMVPTRYNSRSELMRDVKAGSNTEVFDLTTSQETNPGTVGGFNPNP